MDSNLVQLLRAPVIRKRMPPIFLNSSNSFSLETPLSPNIEIESISNDLDPSWSDEDNIKWSEENISIQIVSTKWRSQCEFDSYKNSIEDFTLGPMNILELLTSLKSCNQSTFQFQKRINFK